MFNRSVSQDYEEANSLTQEAGRTLNKTSVRTLLCENSLIYQETYKGKYSTEDTIITYIVAL